MLGSYPRVIQAGRYGVCFLHLPGAVLKQVGHRPMEDARAARAQRGRVLA